MTQLEQRTTKWQVPFFAIWTGQQLSLIGSKVAQFALIWWLTTTTGSATVLATASLVALLPGIAIGPFAGALIDRWSRRWVMIVADSLCALAALSLAYLFWVDALQIWHVYVIIFAQAVGGTFHWPAMAASTSLMVPQEHLTRVAGINQTMNGLLNIAGAPLGVLFMDLLPLHGIMLVDVGTAALAIVPLLFVAVPQPTRAVETAKEGSLWNDVRSGLRYIWGWPGLLILIAIVLICNTLLIPVFSLLPLLVSEHFRGGAGQLSLMEVVLGIGAVAGGLILSAWGGFRRKIYTMLMAGIVFGVGLAMVGLTPATMFGVAVVGVFVVGVVLPMINGPIMAIVQVAVTPEMQGRVFTVMNSLAGLTGPVGLAVAGPASDLIGLQTWFVAAGLITGVISVVGFFVPALVNIEENYNIQAAEEAPGEELGTA